MALPNPAPALAPHPRVAAGPVLLDVLVVAVWFVVAGVVGGWIWAHGDADCPR